MEENQFFKELSLRINKEQLAHSAVKYTYPSNNYAHFGDEYNESMIVLSRMNRIGKLDVYKLTTSPTNNKELLKELSEFISKALEEIYEKEETGYIIFKKDKGKFTDKPRDALSKPFFENHQFLVHDDPYLNIVIEKETKWICKSKHTQGFDEIYKIKDLFEQIERRIKEGVFYDGAGIYEGIITTNEGEAAVKIHANNENYTIYIQNTNPISFRLNYSFSSIDYIPLVFNGNEDLQEMILDFEQQNLVFKLLVENN